MGGRDGKVKRSLAIKKKKIPSLLSVHGSEVAPPLGDKDILDF